MWGLDYKESWAPKNWCFWTTVLKKTLESPLDSQPEIQPIHPKGNQSWIFIHWKGWCWCWNSNTLATWCKKLTHLKRPSCWERLKVGGEGDDRGWGGWMASPTQWTWVWVNSGSWLWTGRPGMLYSMGLQRVRHNWETELNWKLLQWESISYFDALKDLGPQYEEGNVKIQTFIWTSTMCLALSWILYIFYLI